MFKPVMLAHAIAMALALPSVAVAEFEFSGEAKIEYDMFTEDGMVTGSDEEHSAGDPLKTEASVKLFINSDVGEESAFHAELLLANDFEAASDRMEGGESYTQYEIIREFYFDTTAANWDLRLGKQQVVWGTADGIKLLDIMNPTDYRELNQNVSEDSRIPVWMINAERYFDSGANIQFIISEAQPNFIAGLDEDGDSGAPFIFKGVDTITGETNGFLNIGMDMGKTAGVFQTLLGMGGLTSLSEGPMAATTVSQFTSLGTGGMNRDFSMVGAALNAVPTMDLDMDGIPETVSTDAFGDGSGVIQFANPSTLDATNNALLNVVFLPFMSQLQTGNTVLDQAANTSGDMLNNFAGYLGQLQVAYGAGVGIDFDMDGTEDITNAQIGTALNALGSQMYSSVAVGLGYDPDPAVSAGDVATALDVDPTDTEAFNAAIQSAAIMGLQSSFFSNSSTNQFDGTLDAVDPNSTFDLMGNTTFATFTSFIGMQTDYRQEYDTEPFSESNFGFRYRNSTEGGTNYSINYAYRMDSNPYVEIHWEDQAGNTLNPLEVSTDLDALGQPLDFDGDGTVDNPNDPAYSVTSVVLTDSDGAVFDSQNGMNPATLVFEEKLNRISTYGASFDTSIDTDVVPVVVRGEFAYDVGTKQPVINKQALSIGNITEALTMEDADIFKYVLGVDVNVLTNLLVSAQLIRFHNLDYIDEGNNRYTGDFSSMHISNGLKAGDEVETFVSFFLSKPFGSDVQHRWNNIIISENGGGYWNRFDVEYSFNDTMVGTFEYNKYWGDEDTMFGQFEASSNLQLGFKYIF